MVVLCVIMYVVLYIVDDKVFVKLVFVDKRIDLVLGEV